MLLHPDLITLRLAGADIMLRSFRDRGSWQIRNQLQPHPMPEAGTRFRVTRQRVFAFAGFRKHLLALRDQCLTFKWSRLSERSPFSSADDNDRANQSLNTPTQPMLRS